MMPTLYSIVELGGYPDFGPEYRRSGFQVVSVPSVRKALALMKKDPPDVVVAEFNFQSDFRDRTSTLETLMATLQSRYPDCKSIVLYEPEVTHAFQRLQATFPVDVALPFPVDADCMEQALAPFKTS
jgi:ActR/RegA family two-component response regulator